MSFARPAAASAAKSSLSVADGAVVHCDGLVVNATRVILTLPPPLMKEVVFEPNDGFALEATALRFEKLSMAGEFVTATSRKDGNKLVVELQISDQAPTGMLKGDLVVELNHPLVKDKRIMFNGFVR